MPKHRATSDVLGHDDSNQPPGRDDD